MAKWTIFDMLTRAEANAMVAAALRKAAEVAENAYHHADDGTSDPMSPEGIADRILALIPDDYLAELTGGKDEPA